MKQKVIGRWRWPHWRALLIVARAMDNLNRRIFQPILLTDSVERLMRARAKADLVKFAAVPGEVMTSDYGSAPATENPPSQEG